MLIVRDTFLGISRFEQIQERLGISRNVLNQRLAHMVGAGASRRLPTATIRTGPAQRSVP